MTAVDLLLGIDVGTTNTKAVAFDLTGNEVAQNARPTPTIGQGDGQQAHDPEAIWALVAALVRELITGLPARARIAGVAVASVGEEIIPLDEAGRALHPSICWYDNRTEAQAARYAARLTSAETFRISGLPIHPIWSAFKMQWIRDHAPDAFRKAQMWLCMADYITYRLCGEATTSYSLACRTLLFDLRERRWSDSLLDAAGVAAATLPEPVPSGAPAGRVTAGAARATGLAEGTPVAVGGHDHICGALAAGAQEPGAVFDSAGTAEAILVVLAEPALDPELGGRGITVGCHTARDRYYALGAMPAGGVLDWFYRLWTGGQGGMDRDGALAAAAQSPPGAHGLLCLPYLMPGAQPGWGREGVLYGLQTRHAAGDIVRAGMEGLAYEMRRHYESVTGAFGVKPAQIQFAGGLSRSRLIMEIKANVLGIPVIPLAHSELVAQGAAILAGIGAGVYASEHAALMAVRNTAAPVLPDPATVAGYQHLFEQYQSRRDRYGTE
ncbi:MAG: carbohydrate kinase [Firmicutes bacterium]|nr:carbohydrate kinase [Bacillota bacterium]